ncbi:MAG: DUF3014 domain-containing protein [Pseudomonadales bacterium]
MQKALIVVIAVVAVLVIGWAVLRTADEPQEVLPEAPDTVAPAEPVAPPPDPTVPPADQPPTITEAPEPEEPLPPLQDSDPFVRERLEPLELPQAWLDQEQYVRRLAVLAENAARGEVPRRQLAFLAPTEPFKVDTRNEDEVYIDPVSYTRYDPYVQHLVRIEPSRLAGLLTSLEPLVEVALAEIGVQAAPGEVFAEAARQVMAVPVLRDDVELIQPTVMYQYADPELEALSALQKQILRMGPNNVERVQAYLRQLSAEMNLGL